MLEATRTAVRSSWMFATVCLLLTVGQQEQITRLIAVFPVIDLKAQLLQVNDDFVAKPICTEGTLSVLRIQPKFDFRGLHPEWSPPRNRQRPFVAPTEYLRVVEQVEKIRPLGKSLGRDSSKGFVTNLTTMVVSQYENAVIERGLRRVAPNPEEAYWFTIAYYTPRSGVVQDKAVRGSPEPQHLIQLDGVWYWSTQATYQVARKGERITDLELAGPQDVTPVNTSATCNLAGSARHELQ